MNKQTNKDEKQTKRKSAAKGKTTEELTQRHLKDKNHKISDEDIRNIQVSTGNDSEDEPDIPDEKRAHDVDKDNPKSTPWDVISE